MTTRNRICIGASLSLVCTLGACALEDDASLRSEGVDAAAELEMPLTAEDLDPDASGNISVQQGSFDYLDSYLEAFGDTYGAIAGRGQLVRNADGTTTGSVSISGLPANTFFGSHLHRKPCAENGGAHAQDPANCPLVDGANSCAATSPGTELWFSGTTDAKGRLVVQESADFFIPRNAQDGQRARDLSIVIHDTPNNGGSGAGPKMLCVDLPFGRATEGTVSYVTPNTTNDAADDVSGTLDLKRARITRSDDGSTTARLQWTGLTPNFKYPSHVHAAPCTEVSNGGPHYVRDIGCIGTEGNAGVGCQATAETEFWSGGTADGKGRMTVTSTVDHLARAGALSLVLHNCIDGNGDLDFTGTCAGGKPRLACVDFE